MNHTGRRVFLAHNSCLNSSYDLNVLKVGLERDGFVIVDQPELADEVIFSGCSVRSTWVDDAISQIRQISSRASDAKITVTGCIANVSADVVSAAIASRPINFQSHADILRNRTGQDFRALDRDISQDTAHDFEGNVDNGLTQMRRRVGTAKAEVLARLEQLDREHGTALASLYRRTTKGFVFYHEEESAELITVTRSCLFRCSFCSIPRGRGDFESVPIDDILRKASAALDRGVKRLILVGDEVGNYGAEGTGPRFADLLQALVALSPQMRLSIRYIEPKPFMKNAELLKSLCDSGNIDLLYVSLQSGSEKILRAMNRNPDLSKISDAYATFRNTTDVVFYCNWMVGFPGETENDFQQTLKLARALNLHINVAIPFSARPGTPAEHHADQIDDKTKEYRLSRLSLELANMKAAMFEQQLSFLDDEARRSLLQQIKLAEMQQYQAGLVEERPLVFQKRLQTSDGGNA
ncbi:MULTISPECIES: radical SAM protein [Burkholderia]|uniref:radical SAM protein n=1 Tax=Burkholderia TaxID=32008 RepID=UPI00158C28DE|nr:MULTISPECIES: radical SAM protein [Burkholderia cepacia complex]MCA8054026.1 radical SAM protein [Burkholderia cepacia]MCA8131669.1 radical SAM protein [Burkholderia cepacia]MCA8159780.1 radical SAM protein [Burkholderia cepacia]MDN7614207.1 radical SAM protein [Burkholderia cepacia]MDN7635024.1 radical SAM protein [Burkholderia cepacia]